MANLRVTLFVALTLFASAASSQTYTVKNGDSLWKIASKTKTSNVTIHQMIAANHESRLQDYCIFQIFALKMRCRVRAAMWSSIPYDRFISIHMDILLRQNGMLVP